MSQLDYYNAQEKHWVSPRLVLIYQNDLYQKYGKEVLTSPTFQKVREAYSVAIQLFGFFANTGRHYFMQVPKDINESPDIVSMYLDEPRASNERGVILRLQDVEVIEFENHAEEELDTFLIEKKLSPLISKKAYDDKTTILCHIKKRGTFVSHNNLHQKLKEINPKPHINIMGEISGGKYKLTQVWPYIGSVEYYIKEQGLKYPKPDSLMLSLGPKKEIVFGDDKLPLPTIEEVFELRF